MHLSRHLGVYAVVACLAILGLGCGLTEMLQRAPTVTATTETSESGSPAPTDEPTNTSSPASPTATETPTVTPQPSDPATETPTPTGTPPPPTPTETVAPAPTATYTAAPSPTETLPGLRIESFDVEFGDTGSTKVIEASWDTSGATGVRIVVGTSQRFPPWHNGEPDGTTTFELATTIYDHPEVTLTAFGEGGGEAIETITLDWACDHTYFFAGSGTEIPRTCPYAEPARRQGARQPFQGGTMLWVPDIEGRDLIYVLYNDGTWQLYDDTWDESQPESDPAITPPEGLYQPVRGFGKVWRNHAEVQGGLGWAIANESAVPVTYQRQMQESIGGVVYIQVASGVLLRLDGLGGSGSTWTALP